MKISLTLAAIAALAGVAQAADAIGTFDQSRAYASELLADSAARTLAAGDDASAPKVFGNFQTRYLANFGSDKLPAGSDNFVNGFQMRRVRLSLEGQIGSPAWTYTIQGEFNRSGGGYNLAEAYGQYNMQNGWSIRFGQFKLPLYREWIVSHTRQLAAERSSVNTVFGTDYSQGVQATYTADNVRVYAALSDGIRTANTDFTDSAEADYAITGRAEYKWAGDWKQFDGFSSFKNSGFGGMVGGGVHWQSGGDTFNTADVKVLQYALDVTVGGGGWSGFAQFVGRHTDASGAPKLDDFGLVIQGGYFFTDQTEAFGRYGLLVADKDRGGKRSLHEITVGANYYFVPESNAVKFTADLSVIPTKTSEFALPVTSTGTGVVSAAKAQYLLRGQLQMVF